jgi:hypothetical protein
MESDSRTTRIAINILAFVYTVMIMAIVLAVIIALNYATH